MITTEPTTKNNVSKKLQNPFPGLRPFRPEESHLFFGRENQVTEVLDKLLKTRFVGIIGTSGIGKSSFMYCGVLPTLLGDFSTEFHSKWKIHTCRPGEDPIKNLAHSLASEESDDEMSGIEKENIYATLCESSNGLIKVMDEKNKQEQANHLIFIDQFEELFRFKYKDKLASNDTLLDETAAFIELLTTSLQQKEVPFYIIITMRSDFIGDCSQYPKLTDVINESQFLIPQMTREEKRLAIAGPINVMDAKIEDRIVEDILNEIGESADSLPVMQHSLMRTWDYWEKNGNGIEPIAKNHYLAIGGMEKALSIHANEAFNELNDEQKIICEKLFKSITEKNGDRGVRRPTKLKDLITICATSSNKLIEIIDHFRKPGRTLLMPPFDVQLEDNSVIDISHESLMRIWNLLSQWVDEESESVKMYLRLAEAAEMHQLGKAGLWRPPDLILAKNWEEEQQPTNVWGLRYNPAYERTMLFLSYSQKEWDREQERKEKQRKRRMAFLRLIAIGAGIAAIIFILFGFYSYQQTLIAKEATKKAETATGEAKKASVIAEEEKKKAVEASKIAEDEKKKAITASEKAEIERKKAVRAKALAIQAMGKARRNELLAKAATDTAIKAQKQAYAAKAESDRMGQLQLANALAGQSLTIEDKTLKGLIAQQAFNFHRDNVVKEGEEITEENKDLLNKPLVYEALLYAIKAWKGDDYNNISHSENVRAIVTNPTDKLTYATSSDGSVYKLSMNNFKSPTPVVAPNNLVNKAMDVDQYNGKIAVGGDYNFIQIIDTKNGNDKYFLKSNSESTKFNETWFMKFTTYGNDLVTCTPDKKILFWKNYTDKDNVQPELINTGGHKLNCLDVFNNNIAIGDNNGEVTIINLSDKSKSVIHKSNSPVMAISYHSSGEFIAIGLEDGTIKVIETGTPFAAPISTLRGHKARVNALKFETQDGLKLASGSFDKTVRIWNAFEEYTPPLILKDHNSWVWSLNFSDKGKYLLAGNKAGELYRWPVHIQPLTEVLENHVDRNLSSTEWNIFVDDQFGLVKEKDPSDTTKIIEKYVISPEKMEKETKTFDKKPIGVIDSQENFSKKKN